MRRVLLALCGLCLGMPTLNAPLLAAPKQCVSTGEATKMPGKDICVTAHVYDIVALPDGTRFLDVCPPGLPDSECVFTIVSRSEDIDTVGDLFRYRNLDINVRGIIGTYRGRSGLLLSHERQMRGGPPKFRPNAKLLQGYSGADQRNPIHDPNLKPSGHGRTFMNKNETVAIPEPQKP